MIGPSGQKVPDDHEFEEMIKTYQVNLLNHIRAQIPNPEDVKDVYQETLLIAYQKWSSYEEQGKRINWLFTISNHCILRWKRKNAPTIKRGVNLTSPEYEVDQLPAPEEDRGLEELFTPSVTPDERLVLNRYYYERHMVAEIADELGISPSALKKRLERARDHLRDDLEENEK